MAVRDSPTRRIIAREARSFRPEPSGARNDAAVIGRASLATGNGIGTTRLRISSWSIPVLASSAAAALSCNRSGSRPASATIVIAPMLCPTSTACRSAGMPAVSTAARSSASAVGVYPALPAGPLSPWPRWS